MTQDLDDVQTMSSGASLPALEIRPGPDFTVKVLQRVIDYEAGRAGRMRIAAFASLAVCIALSTLGGWGVHVRNGQVAAFRGAQARLESDRARLEAEKARLSGEVVTTAASASRASTSAAIDREKRAAAVKARVALESRYRHTVDRIRRYEASVSILDHADLVAERQRTQAAQRASTPERPRAVPQGHGMLISLTPPGPQDPGMPPQAVVYF
jgi:hypothetical protein